MYLTTFYDSVHIFRRNKAIYARLMNPHLVLSTCRVKGGLRNDLCWVLNHQACEPAGHHSKRMLKDVEGYRRQLCEPLGIEPDRCAIMSTAANMNNAALVKERFHGLEVGAVVTAGVETNAGRAGDPASVMEKEDGFINLKDQGNKIKEGTINIMLFIGHALTKAAIVRAVITATEAKSAALQELSINSRYSNGLATGTGTDQIIVCAPDSPGFRLSWAGKHSKLGELIGRVVIRGVKKSLEHQNRITPVGQCSCKIHLERFGTTRQEMIKGITAFLDGERARLLENNFHCLDRDPLTVANVAAAAHLKDKFTWGILPLSCWKEVMGNAAAQIACAVGGRWDKMASYRDILGHHGDDHHDQAFLQLCFRAFALGFKDKWPDEDLAERKDEK